MRATVVLFDVDGTLIDPAGVGRAAVYDAFQNVFDVSRDALEQTNVPFAGSTDPRIFLALAEALGVSRETLHAREDRLVDVYVDCLRRRVGAPDAPCRILPGVVALIDALDALPDVFLGVLTGNLERGARVKLARFDLDRRFPAGGFASDHEDRRRIARIARERVARHFGVDERSCATVVVGDTEQDVDCARVNGYRSVAVGTGGATAARMTSWRSDAWLLDLEDIAAVVAAIGLGAGDRPTAP